MSGQTIEREQVAIQSASQDGVLTVTIQGDLDIATIPAFCRYLDRARPERPRLIVFDLAEVGFIDCAAARAIRSCQAMPGAPRLVLSHPCPMVRRLLALTGLDAHCAIRP